MYSAKLKIVSVMLAVSAVACEPQGAVTSAAAGRMSNTTVQLNATNAAQREILQLRKEIQEARAAARDQRRNQVSCEREERSDESVIPACKIGTRSAAFVAQAAFKDCYEQSLEDAADSCRRFDFNQNGRIDYSDGVKLSLGQSPIVEFCSCPGDFTGDGVVDAKDNLALSVCYNKQVTDENRDFCGKVDQNHDNMVDFSDLTPMAQNYNRACAE